MDDKELAALQEQFPTITIRRLASVETVTVDIAPLPPEEAFALRNEVDRWLARPWWAPWYLPLPAHLREHHEDDTRRY